MRGALAGKGNERATAPQTRPVLFIGWFSEGFDMADLKEEAKALLDEQAAELCPRLDVSFRWDNPNILGRLRYFTKKCREPKGFLRVFPQRLEELVCEHAACLTSPLP